MVTLKLSYNDSCGWIHQLRDTIKQQYPLLELQTFNEDIAKERKKAFALKSSWATRMSPFAILVAEDKPVKAFYSEDKSCTYEEIINALNSFIVYGS